MKKIPVGNKFATVDDEDFERLSKFTWWLMPTTYGAYAYTEVKTKSGWKTRYMHKMVSRFKKVDHKDRNGLNNQKSNLRKTDDFGNAQNRGAQSNNASGFKGVSFDSWSGKWRVWIKAQCKKFDIGRFESKEKAALAYNAAASNLHGEFAFLNQIPQKETINPAK